MMSHFIIQIIICSIFLIILWVIARLLSKKSFQFQKNNTQSNIQIIEKKIISPKESLILVKVKEDILLIGVTANQINLIHTLSPAKEIQ